MQWTFFTSTINLWPGFLEDPESFRHALHSPLAVSLEPRKEKALASSLPSTPLVWGYVSMSRGISGESTVELMGLG